MDMRGKGGRVRTVPMPSWTKAAIDEWTDAAGFTAGRCSVRSTKATICRGQHDGAKHFRDREEVRRRDRVKEIAPHDLRRTFAKLAHKGRAALEQIQLSLGHASIQTTERYLGVRQDLTDAPCDQARVEAVEFRGLKEDA